MSKPMTIEEMLAEGDRLYAGIAESWSKDGFGTYKKATPAVFTPYYDANLDETIQTAEEKATIDRILLMEVRDLQLLKGDLNTAAAMNPNYRRSRDCTLKCKAILWRINQLKHLGRFYQTEVEGDWGDALLGGLAGWLLADEVWKRLGSS